MKMALVCSSGGHLYQLYMLSRVWRARERFWVSFPTSDATFLLKDERVFWAHYPTNRHVSNLIKNFVLSYRLLRDQRPDVIVSTGAGVGVPFIICGWLLRIKTLYIESITRSEELSLTGYLCLPFVDKLLVQSSDLADKHKKVEFRGKII